MKQRLFFTIKQNHNVSHTDHIKMNHLHKTLSCMPRIENHDDVIKWTHFPRYWPFVRRIHRSPVNSPHKGQWRGALMFTLICARIKGWVNNCEAGDLRRNRAHYDVIVMNPNSQVQHASTTRDNVHGEPVIRTFAWWRHQLETFLRCWPFVWGIRRWITPQRTVTQSFGVFFDLRLE